jgi:hypothetical protein
MLTKANKSKGNQMLKRRSIAVTITLGEGRFGEELGETLKLTGFRVRAHIVVNGGDAQGQCHCVIYGLNMSTINKLTTVGTTHPQIKGRNTIQIDVGVEGETLHTIYIGSIIEAQGTFNEAPDVGLSIVALSAMRALVKPVAATSFKGEADVSQIMAGFAKDMDFAFSDGGVKVMLSNPYFNNTTLEKIRSCARAANINYSTEKGVLSIWPMGGNAVHEPITLSPDTGLVGYPVYSLIQGISVRSLFVPQANLGGMMTIKDSALPMANGKWNIYNVVHTLESEVPNGQWFTDIAGSGQVDN